MDQELEALIQQTLAAGGSPAQMTQIVFDAAASKGIAPEQLPNFTSLSSSDISNGFAALQNQAPVSQGGGIPTGLAGSEQALEGGLTGGLDALRQGFGRADTVLQGISDQFDPFSQAGQGAINLQAALSGAQGPEAQAQAFQNFQSSPGQEFLQQRGEQAINRNASVSGGLGGANREKALAEFGIGIAAQDFGNQFNRLGQVSGQGLNALGAQAGLQGQRANFANQLGQNSGNLIFNTGQNLAQGRTQAGRDLANVFTGGAQNLAGLQQQQGIGLSDLLGASGGNLANLLAGQGVTSGNIATQLGSGLANSGQTAAGQLAGLPGIPGVQQTQGALTSIGQAAGGIGGLLVGLG